MTFNKTLAVGTFLASTLIAGTTLAKGHDNGFGAGAKGSAARMVDENVTNRGGGGSENAYGTNEVRDQVMAGTRDNSEEAQDRDAANHPSNK